MPPDTLSGPSQPQRGRFLIGYPGSGWRRIWMRTPLVYWRLGLKPLITRARFFRFLVLTTRGRKSGQPRHTMLAHFVLDGHIYIGAGWGQRTQWYQNILVDPRVTVDVRGPAFGAVARSVTDEELRTIYRHARGMGPLWMWKRSLESWDIRDDVEDFVAKRDRIPFLRLDPAGECLLPPLRADLVWVWPVLAMIAAAAYVAHMFCCAHSALSLKFAEQIGAATLECGGLLPHSKTLRRV